MKGMNNNSKTSNIQNSPFNAQLAGTVDDWTFGAGCSVLDAGFSTP
jgi:hypothetical protein